MPGFIAGDQGDTPGQGARYHVVIQSGFITRDGTVTYHGVRRCYHRPTRWEDAILRDPCRASNTSPSIPPPSPFFLLFLPPPSFHSTCLQPAGTANSGRWSRIPGASKSWVGVGSANGIRTTGSQRADDGVPRRPSGAAVGC